MTIELIPGQLDLVEELKKIARPTKDELIYLARLEELALLAGSA